MDDTPLDAMLSELESSDPADAPPVADEIARRLAERLDEGDGGGEDAAPPA